MAASQRIRKPPKALIKCFSVNANGNVLGGLGKWYNPRQSINQYAKFKRRIPPATSLALPSSLVLGADQVLCRQVITVLVLAKGSIMHTLVFVALMF